jgi:hypothetical protein
MGDVSGTDRGFFCRPTARAVRISRGAAEVDPDGTSPSPDAVPRQSTPTTRTPDPRFPWHGSWPIIDIAHETEVSSWRP